MSIPKQDNWANVDLGMVCKTCRFYVHKTITRPTDRQSLVGRCRRHAPTMNGFPVVFQTDWCGDHKLETSSEYSSTPMMEPMPKLDAEDLGTPSGETVGQVLDREARGEQKAGEMTATGIESVLRKAAEPILPQGARGVGNPRRG